MTTQFNVGDNVQWTQCSQRGRTLSMKVRNGTIVELFNKVEGNSSIYASILTATGKKFFVPVEQLQLKGDKTTLTQFVEAIREAKNGK